MFVNKEQKVLLFFLLLITVSSCSIDYGTDTADVSGAPDFLFYDTTLTRVQNGNPRAVMQATLIEQYGEENCLYGKDLSFKLLSATGSLTTKGTCNLFSIDQNNQIYSFFDSVDITSYDQDVIISAANLQWNNRTEQMTSDISRPVTITTGTTGPNNSNTTRTTITGTGLVIDGVSRTFTFSETVTGSVITRESQPEGEQN